MFTFQGDSAARTNCRNHVTTCRDPFAADFSLGKYVEDLTDVTSSLGWLKRCANQILQRRCEFEQWQSSAKQPRSPDPDCSLPRSRCLGLQWSTEYNTCGLQ
eukprot:symbB.v1.2.025884.t1/scaffold2545.1/size76554/7